VLKRNSHPHPLIFIRGVSAEELVAVMDFLYFGEANILQQNLDSFLAVAEDLKLKGLRKRSEFEDVIKEDVSPKPNRKPKKKEVKIYESPLGVLDNSDDQIKVPSTNPDAEALEYHEKVQSMMETSDKSYQNGARRAFFKICKVCEKRVQAATSRDTLSPTICRGFQFPATYVVKDLCQAIH